MGSLSSKCLVGICTIPNLVPRKDSVLEDVVVAPRFDPIYSSNVQRQKVCKGISIVFHAQSFQYVECYLEARGYKLLFAVKHRTQAYYLWII